MKSLVLLLTLLLLVPLVFSSTAAPSQALIKMCGESCSGDCSGLAKPHAPVASLSHSVLQEDLLRVPQGAKTQKPPRYGDGDFLP